MKKEQKLKKKIKQLKQKLEQKQSPARKAKSEIKKLKQEIKAQQKMINALRSQRTEQHPPATESVEITLISTNRDKKQVIDQKKAWKRHTFLGECYEKHLDNGHSKEQARALANNDLIDCYGDEVSFTPEQLVVILS